jgi:ATP-dependent DNA ligase
MMLCESLKKEDMPFFLSAVGNKFIADTKLDGDRVRLIWKDKKLTLQSRGKSGDVTRRYPELHDFSYPVDLILDGEMCVMNDKGVSEFNTGIAFRTHCDKPDVISRAAVNYPVTYVIFDILEMGQENLRPKPWYLRRSILEEAGIAHKHVGFSEWSEDVKELWSKITEMKGEGIVLKDRDSPYLEGTRSMLWRKVKDIKEVSLRFVKFSKNNAGIRIETVEGYAVQVSGYKANPVLESLQNKGEAVCTIRHMGWTGKAYRMPVFMKIDE